MSFAVEISLTGYAPRVYYGWWIVIGGGAIFGTVVGLSFFSLGTLFLSLEQELGWSRGEISTALSISFFSGGTFAVIAGWLVDRLGPRITLSLGAVIIAVALFALSNVTAYWQLVLALLLLAVGRATGSQPAVSVTIANWFVRKRSVAFGLSRIGLSTLAFGAVPFTATMISQFGWRSALLINAGVILAVVLPIATLVMRRRPADLGLLPDGDRSAPSARSNPSVPGTVRVQDFTFRAAIRDRVFWILSLALVCFFFAEVSINLHIVPFLTGRGMPFQEAAIVGGGIPATYMIGGLLLGAIAMRYPSRYVISVAYLVVFLAYSLLWVVGGTPLVWLFVLLFGVGAGAILALHTTMVAELFGLRSYGAILGAVTGVFTFGVIFGPMTTGILFDATGNYAAAFVLFGSLQLLGAGTVLFARRRP